MLVYYNVLYSMMLVYYNVLYIPVYTNSLHVGTIHYYTTMYMYCTCALTNIHVGGEIVSTFGNPDKVCLGQCKLIEEVMIGEDKVSRKIVFLFNVCHCMCVADQVFGCGFGRGL